MKHLLTFLNFFLVVFRIVFFVVFMIVFLVIFVKTFVGALVEAFVEPSGIASVVFWAVLGKSDSVDTASRKARQRLLCLKTQSFFLQAFPQYKADLHLWHGSTLGGLTSERDGHCISTRCQLSQIRRSN